MRVIRSCLLIAALLVFSPAYAKAISGMYVGHSNNGAFLIQLVQTADGRVTGRYVQVILKDRKLEETNAAITGASDGKTIAVTLKPNELLSGSISLSGTIEGPSLRMTGGGYGSTLTLNLVKSDEAAFRSQVANLNSQVQRAVAQQRFEEDLTRIEGATKQISTFVANVPNQLAKFPPVEERLKFITEQMRRAYARQQSIFGDGQASVAQGQIAVAINQAGIEADQIRIGIQTFYSDFDSKSGTLLRDAADLQQKCQTADSSVSAADSDKWKSACLRLTTSLPGLQKQVAAARQAFVNIERVWREERTKQEQFIRSADATR